MDSPKESSMLDMVLASYSRLGEFMNTKVTSGGQSGEEGFMSRMGGCIPLGRRMGQKKVAYLRHRDMSRKVALWQRPRAPKIMENPNTDFFYLLGRKTKMRWRHLVATRTKRSMVAGECVIAVEKNNTAVAGMSNDGLRGAPNDQKEPGYCRESYAGRFQDPRAGPQIRRFLTLSLRSGRHSTSNPCNALSLGNDPTKGKHCCLSGRSLQFANVRPLHSSESFRRNPLTRGDEEESRKQRKLSPLEKCSICIRNRATGPVTFVLRSWSMHASC
uniref:Uncharacterized protein n=1 Tax=Steinernema glaseri TaxID=37863 RepID=A0A1I7YH56_9BILA